MNYKVWRMRNESANQYTLQLLSPVLEISSDQILPRWIDRSKGKPYSGSFYSGDCANLGPDFDLALNHFSHTLSELRLVDDFAHDSQPLSMPSLLHQAVFIPIRRFLDSR